MAAKTLYISNLTDDTCCEMQQVSIGNILKPRILSVSLIRETVGREAAKFVFYLEKPVVLGYSFGAA